jgi:cytochrome P450
VHWTEGLVRGFWSVTRYDDILAVFRAFKSECTTRCISRHQRAGAQPKVIRLGNP